jgi:hypothetical protein
MLLQEKKIYYIIYFIHKNKDFGHLKKRFFFLFWFTNKRLNLI